MAKREAEMVHHWYHSDLCHELMNKLYEDIIPVLAGRPLRLGGLALYNMLSPEHAAVLSLVFDQQVHLARTSGMPFRFMNMGCGVGGVSDLLCERESFKLFEGERAYYPVEKDPVLGETMRQKYRDRPNTEVMIAGPETPLPTHLQLIIAIDMLYFIRSQADKAAFILRLFSCLAPGGMLFFNMGGSLVPTDGFGGDILPAEHPSSPLATVIKTFQDMPRECRMNIYTERYWQRWEKFKDDFETTPPSEDWVVEATRGEVTQIMTRQGQPGIKGGRWAVTLERLEVEEPGLV
jgi:SAM-dependent methyltransferase